MEAALPKNEELRLGALAETGILDTGPEEDFDSVVRLVSQLLDVPIALVSLIDRDRQWFKACVGLDSRQTVRGSAFCAHAILGDGPLVVPDATKDERFRDNPMVVGQPHIRFYAGMPLVLEDGAALGTLCAIDQWPRTPTREQVQILQEQARVVVAQIELRRASRNLIEKNRELTRSNELLERFARALAHDVMSPIQQISFFTDELSGTVDGAAAGDVAHLRGAAHRLERLVMALRDYVEAGGTFPCEPIDLGPIVESALSTLRSELEAADANVIVGELPRVVGHAEHLQRVFDNLVTNAIKYRGDRPLELRIDAESCGDHHRIHVRDNGVGIPREKREDAFAPMRRLHGDGDIPGVGLGLAIVRQIVEACGGRAGLDVADGGGTDAWIELPSAD
ncbi:MAG: GAF domain-containing sensor histidine kinase [Planctomycetota bacterium]